MSDFVLPDEHDREMMRVLNMSRKVLQKLGTYFNENVYRAALAVELRREGYETKEEETFGVKYEGEEVGNIRVDILVSKEEKKYILELKKDVKVVGVQQLITYLETADMDYGYIVRFLYNDVKIEYVFREKDGNKYKYFHYDGESVRRSYRGGEHV